MKTYIEVPCPQCGRIRNTYPGGAKSRAKTLCRSCMNSKLQNRRFENNRWFWYNKYNKSKTPYFTKRKEAFANKPPGIKTGWLLCKIDLKTEIISQYNGRPIPD